MIETTFDIADANCEVESDAGGAPAQQAELVAFAHYVARVFLLLGPARAGAVVETLITPGETKWPDVPAPSEIRAIVRFVDGASGPRLYFRLKASGKVDANLSVDLVRRTLCARHEDEARFGERLVRAAELMGRLGATGQVNEGNEFDVSLAASDVAWRSEGDDALGVAGLELECRGCGNRGPSFEPRLWPSEEAALARCGRCGAGVWCRTGHRARSIRPDVWAAMEAMRAQLSGAPPAFPASDGSHTLLGELKRVFVENGWPYTDVDGAPVLVSELSGPEGPWDFYAQAVEGKDLVLLYSIAPRRVPEALRPEVAAFLTRANYGLADGNFELDFDDGEVRFKTVLHVQGDGLDALLVKRIVRANGTALETYLPSIDSMIGATRT
jgi:hypothetical protein